MNYGRSFVIDTQANDYLNFDVSLSFTCFSSVSASLLFEKFKVLIYFANTFAFKVVRICYPEEAGHPHALPS